MHTSPARKTRQQKKLARRQEKLRKKMLRSLPRPKRLPRTAFGRFLTGSRANRSVGGSLALLIFLFLLSILKNQMIAVVLSKSSGIRLGIGSPPVGL